ncbi:hypothetical protein [Methylovirgula sp. HY1]|uniref:hypothetical protein n=1 Tax=Methylovirgula sp. HY1 TaxID=2822761 RepID=UPI001C5AE929|nr:hypothetical protein [Methylovirgula sp. HY1]QXX73944.1 hypothetical protein MHY1_00745 [Methylovirgula sp. HY1]
MNRMLEHAISAARRLPEAEQVEIGELILAKIKAMHGELPSAAEDLPEDLPKIEATTEVWDVNA